MRRDNFFIVMSFLCLAVVLIGFAPVYYLRAWGIVPWDDVDAFSRYGAVLPTHLHLHGLALTTWYVLFALQTTLIHGNRILLHRTLGIVGIAVAVCVVATGFFTVFYRDAYHFSDVTARSIGNLFTLVTFGICFAGAVWFRSQPYAHKRLMLVGSVAMLLPALERFNVYPAYRSFAEIVLGWLPGPTPFATPIGIGALMLLAVVAHDLIKERRVLKSTCFGMLSMFVIAPVLCSLLIFSGLWAFLIRMLA